MKYRLIWASLPQTGMPYCLFKITFRVEAVCLEKTIFMHILSI